MDHPLTRRTWLRSNAFLAAGASLSECSPAEGEKRPVIWDGHCHLSGIAGKTPQERMARMLEIADRFGIEKLVCFMGWPFSVDPSPEEVRRQNEQVAAAIRSAPKRAMGYVYVNPRHVQTSLEEIDRWMGSGPMVGIKLWVALRCHDRRLDPIVDRVARYGGVVFQHTWIKTTGNLAGESTPQDLVTLAKRHPQARFICGHAGGNWELGIRAVRSQRNISVELAGSEPTSGFTEMAVRELGAERVVFGSDASGRSFASQLAKVFDAAITQQDREAILARNLQRLLAPALRRTSSHGAR